MLILTLLACQAASIDLDDSGTKGTDTTTPSITTPTGTTGTTDPTPVEDNSGDYAGPLDSSMVMNGGGGTTPECDGDATLHVAEDGTLAGEATCSVGGAPPVDGPLEGSVSDGDAAFTWSINLGFTPVEVPMTGIVGDGTLTAHGEIDIEGLGYLTVNIAATR